MYIEVERENERECMCVCMCERKREREIEGIFTYCWLYCISVCCPINPGRDQTMDSGNWAAEEHSRRIHGN